MIDKIQEAVLNNRSKEIEAAYALIGKTLDRGCSSCLSKARTELIKWLRDQHEPNAKINLFVMVYEAHTPERQDELDECLKRNYENPFIDTIVKVSTLVTYNQMFELSRKFPDDINIIANSDIWFDETIELVKEMKRLDLYALARWELSDTKAKLLARSDAQDAWIFRGGVYNVDCDYSQGRPGCDNNSAFRFHQAGFKVSNPAASIRSFHVHESNDRSHINTHWNKVSSPYMTIHPHRIDQIPQYVISG